MLPPPPPPILRDYWSIRFPFLHTLTGGRTPREAQAAGDKDLGISVSICRNLWHLEACRLPWSLSLEISVSYTLTNVYEDKTWGYIWVK